MWSALALLTVLLTTTICHGYAASQNSPHSLNSRRQSQRGRSSYGGFGAADDNKVAHHPHRQRLQRAIVAGLMPEVDVKVIADTVTALQRGELALPADDLEFQFFFNPTQRMTPAADVLWAAYMRTVDDPDIDPEVEPVLRELLLILLAQGLDVGGTFEEGAHQHAGNLAGTPLGHLLRRLGDPELIDAFLGNPQQKQRAKKQSLNSNHNKHSVARHERQQHSNYDVSGTLLFAPPFTELDEEPVIGVSLLHFLANSALEVTVIRKFYKLALELERVRNTTADEGAIDRAFETALDNSPIARMAPFSATVRQTLDRIRSGVPLKGHNMSRPWATNVDYDLQYYLMTQLLHHSDDFDLVELIFNSPSRPDEFLFSNPILLATSLEKPGIVQAVTDFIRAIPSGEDRRKGYAQLMLRKALEDPSRYKGRSALHMAAVRYGKQSRMWEAIVDAELVASGDLR